MAWNLEIFYFFNNLAGKNVWFDRLIIFLAQDLGYVILAAVLIFLIFHCPSKPWPGSRWKERLAKIFIIFGGTGLAFIVTQILKKIILSPRPELFLSEANFLLIKTGFDSFPSAHATFFAALATLLYFYNKKAGRLAWLGALLIGLSRIAAGVHFPIDILFGWLIGFLTALTVARITKKL